MKAQKAFANGQKLAYPLLSDADGSVATKYDVLMRGRFAKRVTFLVDPDGILRHIDRQVRVQSHGPDVAAKIEALKAE